MNKRIDNTHLSAAMATPEQAVAVPTRSNPASVKNQIEALEPGEFMSKPWLIAPESTFAAWAADSSNQRERLRNSLTSSVAKAKALTGGTYTIEVGDMLLGGKMYIVAIVTRIE